MKRLVQVLSGAGVAGCLTLTGCASMSPEPGTVIDTDWEKVRIVERYHQQRGSMVVWMNYPTRPVAAVQVSVPDPK